MINRREKQKVKRQEIISNIAINTAKEKIIYNDPRIGKIMI